MTSLDSHYQTLELTIGATFQDVRDAYRRLIKRWHPDQFANDLSQLQIAEEKIKEINIAYNILKSRIDQNGSSPAPHDSKIEFVSSHRRAIEATRLYEEACDSARLGHYQDAAKTLSLAIKINPNYARAYRYRGLIYSQLGYERRANADLSKATDLEAQISPPDQTGSSNSPTDQSIQPEQKSENIPTTTGWTCQTLEGHADGITGLAVHRNTLISCGRDGQIHLWNLTTQKLFSSLSEGRSPIQSMALSRDGQLLTTGDNLGIIRLWHLPTNTLLKTLPENGDTSIRSLVLSLEHGIIISASSKDVISVWDLRKGQLIQSLTGQVSAINSLQYWPQQSMLIAGCGDGALRTWNLSKKYSIQCFPVTQTAIYTMLLGLKGKRLILAGADGLLRTWSTVTEELGPSIAGQQGALNSLAMSSDSVLLASGSEQGSVRIWKMQDGSLQAHLSGHQGPIMASCFWRDQLITGSLDQTIRVWMQAKG